MTDNLKNLAIKNIKKRGSKPLSWDVVLSESEKAGFNKIITLHEKFSRKSFVPTWSDLRLYSQFVKFTSDHENYCSACWKYDRGVCFLGSKEAIFSGSGGGGGSLNSYRKVIYKGRSLFEKVYDSSSIDFESVYSFELARRQLPVKSPTLFSIFNSKCLSVVYYEYVSGKQLADEVFVSEVLDLCCKLSAFNPGEMSYLLDKDFKSDELFFKSFARVSEIMNWEPSKATQLLMIIDSYACKVVSHGDLNRGNLLDDGVVIDWDKIGVYPYGWDFALALSSLRERSLDYFPVFLEEVKSLGGSDSGLKVFPFLLFYLSFSTVFSSTDFCKKVAGSVLPMIEAIYLDFNVNTGSHEP